MSDARLGGKLPPLFASESIVDQFKIVRLIAQGGQGEVYLARDAVLGRKVALKVIRPQAIGDQQAIERFLTEARATARFVHPHIVTVFAAGVFEGRPYVALEYLDGQTLRERTSERAPTVKETIRHIHSIADAIREAHRHDLLHRDLKPDNVLIPRDGRLRVVDFGLVKRARFEAGEKWAGAELTTSTLDIPAVKPGDFSGTPAYMAPEQWMDGECTKASDIWALGIIFYELLAGHRPFDGRTMIELGARIAGTEPAPPLPELEGLPESIAQLVMRMLDKHPKYRPTADEVYTVLEAAVFERPRPSVVEEESPFRGLSSFSERHAELFFGREAEIAGVLERLREEPMLTIVGASGAGKSSFVRAGLIPRIRERARSIVVDLRPGPRPFLTLTQKLLSRATSSTSHPPLTPGEGDRERAASPLDRAESEALAAELYEMPELAAAQLRALADRVHGEVLLFVDQLEEIYTLVDDVETRRRFVRAIFSAVDDPRDPVRVIVTVRDDFLGRIAEGASAAIRQVVVLRTPEKVMLEEILERPVAAVGYAWEDPKIPREMIAEVLDEPAALPLLQFASRAMWDRRDRTRHLLLRSTYDEIGGVIGALASHADGVIDAMIGEEQTIARELFLRLVTRDRTKKLLPREALLDALGPSAADVLDRLVAARLVVPRRSRDTDDAELELAHEALIISWSRLAHWIDESKEERAALAELAQAAELWDRRGRAEHALWRGEPLRDAVRAVDRAHQRAPALVREFVEAGTRADKRNLRLRNTAIAVIVAVLTVAAALFYEEKEAAHEERKRADIRRAEAEREGAEAAFERGDLWSARAKARTALEIDDTLQARALWSRLRQEPAVFERKYSSVVPGLAWSPDGTTLAVSVHDGSAYLHDAKTFEARELRPFDQEITFNAIAFSPSSKWMAFGGHQGEIALRELATGAQRSLPNEAHAVIWTFAFSPDESILVAGSYLEAALVYRLDTGRLLHRLDGHTDRVYGVAVSPDGARIATGSWDKTIRLWRADSGALDKVLNGHPARVMDVRFSPDGSMLASSDEIGTILLWDIISGENRGELIGHRGRVSRISFDASGERLASAGGDRTVRLWSVRELRELELIGTHSSGVRDVGFDPKGLRVASTTRDDATLKVWNLGVRGTGWRVPLLPEATRPIAISPDGKVIAAGLGGNAPDIAILDAKSGDVRARLQGHDDPVYALRFSPDGRALASVAGDRTVRVWDVARGISTHVLSGHQGTTNAVLFSPDGRILISADTSGVVRLWNVESGTLARELKFRGRLFDLALSPSGKRGAIAMADGSVLIFDTNNGRELAKLAGEGAPGTLEFGRNDNELLIHWPLGPAVLWKIGSPVTQTIAPAHRYQETPCLAFDRARDAVVVVIKDRLVSIALGADRHIERWSEPISSAVYQCVAGESDTLLSVGESGTLRTWSLATGTPLLRAPLMVPASDTSSSSTVELLTQEGWHSLTRSKTQLIYPAKARWREALERDAKSAVLSANGAWVCAAMSEGDFELWDRSSDTMLFRERAPRMPTRALLALENGCVFQAGSSAYLYLRSGTFRELAGDIRAVSNTGVLVSGEQTYTFDADGALTATGIAPRGTTAILHQKSGDVFGLPTGELVIGQKTIAGASRTAVVAVASGPRETIVAAHADGQIAVLLPSDGTILLRGAVHGPVQHLLVEDGVVYAASEVGSFTAIDLSRLELEYCELLREVWANAPMIWQNGKPQRRDPPADHICAHKSYKAG